MSTITIEHALSETRHTITAEEAYAGFHAGFVAIEDLAKRLGVCPTCLTTRSLLQACYHAARSEATKDGEAFTKLTERVKDAMVLGWRDGIEDLVDEEELGGGEVLSLDIERTFDLAALMMHSETRH